MEVNRRGFIKLAGLAASVAVVKPAFDLLTRSGAVGASSSADAITGGRLAMVIDLKACKSEEGCTDCIDACHSIHNVPNFPNPKDEIKWIWDVPFENGFPDYEHRLIEDDLKHRPSLILCNHCDNPPCVSVCPTRATYRRDDGLVMMDYHRCIGCRYCMAACPYGSRSFNWRDPRPFIKEIDPTFPTRTRGVVEKCNFCAERLAVGLGPACVAACKEKGLAFGDLEDPDSEIRELLRVKHSILRKPAIGTKPQIYYLV